MSLHTSMRLQRLEEESQHRRFIGNMKAFIYDMIYPSNAVMRVCVVAPDDRYAQLALEGFKANILDDVSFSFVQQVDVIHTVVVG